MKCPKCGSEYQIGGTDVNGNLVCRACQLKELKELGFLNDKNIPQTTSSNKIIIETEITTAEMLLWIAENFNVNIKDGCGIEVTIEDRKNGRWADYFVGNEYESKTLAEAIKAAYEWAIKEVER